MRRVVIVLLCIIGFAFSRSWGESTPIEGITVLPFGGHRALVSVETPQPVVIEVTTRQGSPAIWLKETNLPNTLHDGLNYLNASSFIRPAPYHVLVEKQEEGSWLVFQTNTALDISVVTSAQALLEEASRELAVYPSWPVTPVIEKRDPGLLVDNATQAFNNGDYKTATELLEQLFYMEQAPSKPLYQVLGLLYLQQKSWLKALCLYGQGAHQYPEALGLRYSALLYQLQQPQKAAKVLSDLVITAGLAPETLAQAHYMLGSIYAEEKRFDQAIAELKQVQGAFGNSPFILYNLAVSYEGAQKQDLALDTYQQALPWVQGQEDLLQDIRSQIQRLQSITNTAPLQPQT